VLTKFQVKELSFLQQAVNLNQIELSSRSPMICDRECANKRPSALVTIIDQTNELEKRLEMPPTQSDSRHVELDCAGKQDNFELNGYAPPL
jgi:hypothetical protein